MFLKKYNVNNANVILYGIRIIKLTLIETEVVTTNLLFFLPAGCKLGSVNACRVNELV